MEVVDKAHKPLFQPSRYNLLAILSMPTETENVC
jgi:hypothetical protein